ncbi:MAG: long-chain fatty acid--CoA ligase [Dehalococcoidia bacterium]
MPEEHHPLTLPAALARAAQRFIGRTAYVEGRRMLTWPDMAQQSREIAAGLIGLGLQRGDRVAICAENSIDWVLACQAVSQAGGIAVLVYFELKAEEISRQVQWPQCRYLIASPSVLERIDEAKTGVEQVIGIGAEPADAILPFAAIVQRATDEARAALHARSPEPDDVAVIVYTSGTTSGAKGVMLTHRNLLSNANAAQEAMSFSPDEVTMLVLPLHHALPFLAAVVLVSVVGAKTVLENDLRRIRDRLQEHSPTIFFGVPALYELMYRNVMARAEAEGRLAKLRRAQKVVGAIKRTTGISLAPVVFKQVHKALGGKLKYLVSGGAALNPQTARDFMSLGLPLLQGWGMTEASPAIAIQRYSHRKFMTTNYYEDHVGSVGTALPGVEVRLIDVPEKDIRVAVHGEGEVIVRGPNVFVGYWGAEELTREAMLDGWLRTGDLGRIDKDGNIYLTGRSKYVIVLESGEKVHPDEVETKLQESELLHDCVILARAVRDGKTGVGLVVYPDPEAAQKRVAESGEALTEASIRAMVQADIDRLCREIAAYKRVTKVELSDEPLPKTPLRKVARGLIRDGYEFNFEKWLASVAEVAD